MGKPRALREKYTAHASLRPIYTHLHPSALPDSTTVHLPTDATFTEYPSLITPSASDASDTLTALLSTPQHVITAHRSGNVVVHSDPPRTVRPFRDATVVAHLVPDPSFSYVAVAAADGPVRVYSADAALLTHVLDAERMLSVLAFAPGGHVLLIGREDGTILAFDLTNKSVRPIRSLPIHVRKVAAIDFVPGAMISVASDRSLAYVPMKATRFENPRLLTAPEPLRSVVSFGHHVVTASETGVLRLWDMKKHAEIPSRALTLPFVTARFSTTQKHGHQNIEKRDHDDDDDESGHAIEVVDMRRSGPHRLIVSLSDQTILFVQVSDDLTLSLDNEVICGNLEEIYDLRAIESPKEKTNVRDFVLATNSSTLWAMTVRAESFAPIPPDAPDHQTHGRWMSRAAMQGHTGIVLSVDTRNGLIASGARDRTARVWRRAGDKWACAAIAEGHTDAVAAVALSPKAAAPFVVTGAADNTVKLWSLADLGDGIKKLSARWTILAHAKDVNAVAVSPDASLIASGSQDRKVKLWSASRGRIHVTCEGHKRGIWSVTFSPIDQIVASTSGDTTVRLWSVATGACLRTLQGHMGGVLKSVFISSGTQLVTSGADGLVKVWLTRTGECGATVDAHDDRAWALDALADGALVVSGGADGRVRLWTDATELVKKAERKRRDEEVLMGQAVADATRARNWAVAIRGALELGMTTRLGEVFSELVTTVDDPDAEMVDTVVAMLRVKESSQKENWGLVRKLLLACREWVSSGGARNALLAAHVLNAVFAVWTVDELCDNLGPEQKLLVEELLRHVDRHVRRVGELEVRIALLEHTLEQMRGLGQIDQTDGAASAKILEKVQTTGNVAGENGKVPDSADTGEAQPHHRPRTADGMQRTQPAPEKPTGRSDKVLETETAPVSDRGPGKGSENKSKIRSEKGVKRKRERSASIAVK